MIKTNFKHALVLAIGVAGITLGSASVASANAIDGGNQQYSDTQTAENSQTVQTMVKTSSTGNSAVVSQAKFSRCISLTFGVANQVAWIVLVSQIGFTHMRLENR